MHKRNALYKPAAATKARYRILYGGSGSGKSVFVAQDELRRAAEDGDQRILVLRKVAKTSRRSTFQLFLDIIAGMQRTSHVQINRTEMSITFPSGGEIIHAGLDDVEKLKSIAGVTRIWVEEATELTYNASREEHDFDQIDLRLRGVDPAQTPQITLTFNPAKSAKWIQERFGIVPGSFPEGRSYAEKDDVYVQHTTHLDNPFSGEEYAKVFERLPDAMRSVYEKGEFVEASSPDQVIPYEYVKRASQVDYDEGPQRMGVDVARFGDDDTVFAYLRGNQVVSLDVHGDIDTNRTSQLVINSINERSINADRVGVDAVGIGAGVVDNLVDAGYDVVEVVSGASPVHVSDWNEDSDNERTAFRFKNLRSQMWWYAREQLRQGKLSFADAVAKDSQLVEDLCAPRYRFSSDRMIEVEPKDGRSKNWGIKQRIGRSPDRADALIYGLFVEHLQNKIEWIV